MGLSDLVVRGPSNKPNALFAVKPLHSAFDSFASIAFDSFGCVFDRFRSDGVDSFRTAHDGKCTLWERGKKASRFTYWKVGTRDRKTNAKTGTKIERTETQTNASMMVGRASILCL